MNLTEDEKAYLFLDALICRLAYVGIGHKLKKAVKAVEEPTPIYFDTDSIDLNPKIYVVLSNRGCGKSVLQKRLIKQCLNSYYGKTVMSMKEKKMTNLEKFKEVFGVEPKQSDGTHTCPHKIGFSNVNIGCVGTCACCKDKLWNSEYKEPVKINKRRVKYFATVENVLGFIRDNKILDKDVVNIVRSDGNNVLMSWCLIYDELVLVPKEEEEK